MQKHMLHEKNEFKDMRHLVEWAADTYGEKYAYSYKPMPSKPEVKRISFNTFRDDIRALTSKLIEMGCSGKHCAVIGKLSYEWALLYFSILSSGGIIVPLDKDWQAAELAKTANKADVTFLFIDEDMKEKATVIAGENDLSAEPIFICGNGSGSGVDALLSEGRKIFAENSNAYFENEIDAYKMSVLVFTSGTTGEGKGVMLTQNSILSDISNVAPYLDYSDKTVGVLPPHHTYGSSVIFAAHAMIGAEVYISAGLRYIQKELRDEKPGHLALVPLYLETFYRKIQAGIKEQKKEMIVAAMIKISNLLRKVAKKYKKRLAFYFFIWYNTVCCEKMNAYNYAHEGATGGVKYGKVQCMR